MTEQRKPGERWRFVFEGVIDSDGDLDIRGDDRTSVRDTDAGAYVNKRTFPRATSAERLPDPEPEWNHGDIADDSTGRRWQRTTSRAWMAYPWPVAFDDTRKDKDMRRPLTPVMLDGRLMSEIEGSETE